MWAQVSFVVSQITRLTDRRTDRRTDGRTAFSCYTVRCITCCRNVKCYEYLLVTSRTILLTQTDTQTPKKSEEPANYMNPYMYILKYPIFEMNCCTLVF